jgi:hypothetical protein
VDPMRKTNIDISQEIEYSPDINKQEDEIGSSPLKKL